MFNSGIKAVLITFVLEQLYLEEVKKVKQPRIHIRTKNTILKHMKRISRKVYGLKTIKSRIGALHIHVIA